MKLNLDNKRTRILLLMMPLALYVIVLITNLAFGMPKLLYAGIELCLLVVFVCAFMKVSKHDDRIMEEKIKTHVRRMNPYDPINNGN